MSLHHSEATHQQLVERVPTVTGRDLPHWFEEIENGPSLLRFDERVNWLRDEHGIAQPVEVMDDGAGRESEGIAELLDGHRASRQEADDPQSRGVREGFEDLQQVFVHDAGHHPA